MLQPRWASEARRYFAEAGEPKMEAREGESPWAVKGVAGLLDVVGV